MHSRMKLLKIYNIKDEVFTLRLHLRQPLEIDDFLMLKYMFHLLDMHFCLFDHSRFPIHMVILHFQEFVKDSPYQFF